MEIKAKYEDGKFVPIEGTEFKNIDSGDVVELQIIPNKEKIIWKGALKHIKKSSIELQHEIKDHW
ncbi:hypothetical protein CMI38_04115 [Candidatus Pacearchaeota archaeon]|jgi:predicted DNA-binding antitoxin AbrB/MazE fold protein|nr:hypothetical protein [Candidatus Pacearchaeota archaeon]|tara:strand:- start:1500 stop:1694 length:195 start_codon:yes stop_codon:yes gene_type:complete